MAMSEQQLADCRKEGMNESRPILLQGGLAAMQEDTEALLEASGKDAGEIATLIHGDTPRKVIDFDAQMARVKPLAAFLHAPKRMLKIILRPISSTKLPPN